MARIAVLVLGLVLMGLSGSAGAQVVEQYSMPMPQWQQDAWTVAVACSLPPPGVTPKPGKIKDGMPGKTFVGGKITYVDVKAVASMMGATDPTHEVQLMTVLWLVLHHEYLHYPLDEGGQVDPDGPKPFADECEHIKSHAQERALFCALICIVDYFTSNDKSKLCDWYRSDTAILQALWKAFRCDPNDNWIVDCECCDVC